MPSRACSRSGSGGEAVRGRRFGGTHRGSQEEGRDPPQTYHPDDAQRPERPSRRVDERLRHRDCPLLPRPARRSDESDLARPRPVRPEQGPRLSGLVRGPRGTRVLPGRGAHDVPQAEQPPPRTSGARHDSRRRERRGCGRPRPLLLRRPGARGPDGPQGMADLLRPRRRRAGRRADMGGRDGRVEVRPRQPHRVHRPERDPAGGPDGGHHAARAPRRKVGGVQLARPHDRRTRLPSDLRRDRGGSSHAGPAHRGHRADGEGEGRLLHGEQDQVSRRGDERRGAEVRPSGARCDGGGNLTGPPWKQESQRSYFAKALIDLGRRNPDVVVVGADTTESIKTFDFGKAFPDRLFQLGIAEPNMISVAAGLAAAGKIPFASTYSVFGAAHTYNIIRQNVAYTNLNVKIFCSHAGLTVGPDGATHQMNEDIALMRGIPRMTVLVPADGPETAKCVDAAAAMKGPVYCRFSRTNVPTLTSMEDDFSIGRARVLRDGSDVALIGCGLMVAKCLEAADALKRAGFQARVINLSTVKPLDVATIDRAARETGGIVTAEEHTVVHGIGAAVASAIAANHPGPIAMVGVQDVFGESGEAEELLRKYGLTAEKIVDAVHSVMKGRDR